MLQIILSSTNSAKKQAVINFFQDQNIEFELLCLDVESGVNKTPNSDEEGIIGSQNRIKNAKIELKKMENLGKVKFENFERKDSQQLQNESKNQMKIQEKLTQTTIFIGMEGIINVNKFGTFLGGWVCLEINNQEYLGCSARCQLPKSVAENATNFRELSQTVKEVYQNIPNVNELVDRIGTNGLLTNGFYTRIDEFEDALKCSFGIFSNMETMQLESEKRENLKLGDFN